MFYRVVMQGRTMGGADVAAVKREFVRVTGLPVSVADDMFAGMPKIIKRKAPQADAERIAATLRAIGAAATVEREVGSSDPGETDEGIEIIATPLGNGPPTVAPGMTPAEPQASGPLKKAWVRDLGDKWPVVLGTFALIGAAVYFGPEISGWVASLRPAAVAAAAPKAAAQQTDAAAAAESIALNASLLHGPWRCVDQRTGLGVYWSYAADGGLIFHGDVLSDRPAQASAGAATGWTLEGVKLLHKHAQGEVDVFKVANLTLSRLRYHGDRGLEIECRRP